jgi:hypothetical protein
MLANFTKGAAAAVLSSIWLTGALAEPKYSASVPESVKTPDRIETKQLGTLEFFDGMPTKETVQKVYDNLDLTRGITAFLDGIPITSLFTLLRGIEDAGVKPGEIAIYENLMDANSLYLTPNSTTMYVFARVDISDEPMVIDAPARVLGFVDDAAFRFVGDIGFAGPDKGEGGRFVIVPRNYEGDIPPNSFVFESQTNNHWLLLRTFIENGNLEASANRFKDGLNLYPLSMIDAPPTEIFHNLSSVEYNTIHANNFMFFEELNEVVQREPADAFDPELAGNFAAIGIKKGEPFKPDERMLEILTEAAAIGNATARALSFRSRKDYAFAFKDRKWTLPFAGGSHDFMDNGARVLDDRSYFHYVATGITPAMVSTTVGQGSAYMQTALDSDGDYLDGGNTYSVTLPAPVPAGDFWAFTVYSGQHRGFLETDQRSAGIDSTAQGIQANEDGSYTLWFSPKPPAGKEANWVQTVEGKSFNSMFRLYGPLEGWFEKTWTIGDFELVD